LPPTIFFFEAIRNPEFHSRSGERLEVRNGLGFSRRLFLNFDNSFAAKRSESKALN